MDKLRQKSKKDKPQKCVEKEKAPLFITDVKTIKENLKIKEILRTVKMNSSMRIKAPRGSRVMHNKDFHDSEDGFEEVTLNAGESMADHPTATNLDVVVNSCIDVENEVTGEDTGGTIDGSNRAMDRTSESRTDKVTALEPSTIHKSISFTESSSSSLKKIDYDLSRTPDIEVTPTSEYPPAKPRDRKLSLDFTMLARREGLSQSELDLHSIGKSPLERKSSFFRKRMDSFLKNTTEIFKRQSQTKSTQVHRRGSMSVSLQSLNENTTRDQDCIQKPLKKNCEVQKSATSLQSCSTTTGRSHSSLSMSQGERAEEGEDGRLLGSQPALTTSQPLGDMATSSVHSLNEAYIQESLLNSRAISMSSGLDTALGKGRRKSSRSNRVSWLASEGLTNYFKRQEEKNKEMQACYSYQDFSAIPENSLYGSKLDSKGRRLSYQRAVSGEDPVLSSRYQDTLRRKALIPENSELSFELVEHLTDKLKYYSENGIPELQSFKMHQLSQEAQEYLEMAEQQIYPENYNYRDLELNPNDESKQAVVKELIATEVNYIRHLTSVVKVFIAAAHDLQDHSLLLELDTEKLFSNIVDVLNANLQFFELAIYPMMLDAHKNGPMFNTQLMMPGFERFKELFQPYETYVKNQNRAMDYLRSLSSSKEFTVYLSWCLGQSSCDRLQLADILVKPLQRVTKYSLLLKRINDYTESPMENAALSVMELNVRNYVQDLNRTIRKREERDKVKGLLKIIEPMELDLKDEDMERIFRQHSQLNLMAPMAYCSPSHNRNLVHQGDLRFKDNVKEFEARILLFTDFLLVCKKQSKGGTYTYRQTRPKYMTNRLEVHPRHKSSGKEQTKELTALVCLVVDEVGSSTAMFTLTDIKDNNTLRMWEHKIREAQVTYKMCIALEKDQLEECRQRSFSGASGSSAPKYQISEESQINRDAIERLATMRHAGTGASSEWNVSQTSMATDSLEGGAAGWPSKLRQSLQRTSTSGSSRNSRLSSFQKSISTASHDEPHSSQSENRPPTDLALEKINTPLDLEDGLTSITVTIVCECEPDACIGPMSPLSPSNTALWSGLTTNDPSPQVSPNPECPSAWPVTPMVVLQQPSPSSSPSSRSASTSRNTLRVQPFYGNRPQVHSLPDLTTDNKPREILVESPMSASEQLYQSHAELLERNRLTAAHQQKFLHPDHGAFDKPTRGILQRGLAVCHSNYPPNFSEVSSEPQLLALEEGPSTSQQEQVEQEFETVDRRNMASYGYGSSIEDYDYYYDVPAASASPKAGRSREADASPKADSSTKDDCSSKADGSPKVDSSPKDECSPKAGDSPRAHGIPRDDDSPKDDGSLNSIHSAKQ